MTLKAELTAGVQAAADATSGNEGKRLRSGYGAPGTRVLVDGESEETGQSWDTPGFADALMEGLAAGLGARIRWGVVNGSTLAVVAGNLTGAASGGPAGPLTVSFSAYSSASFYANAVLVNPPAPFVWSAVLGGFAVGSVDVTFVDGAGAPIALAGTFVLVLVVGAVG